MSELEVTPLSVQIEEFGPDYSLTEEQRALLADIWRRQALVDQLKERRDKLGHALRMANEAGEWRDADYLRAKVQELNRAIAVTEAELDDLRQRAQAMGWSPYESA